MKRTVCFVIMLVLAVPFFSLSAFAESDGAAIVPGAIVDFSTSDGYTKFLDTVEWDTKHLFTGEYTVHGMDGKVNYSFNEEGYTTFVPKEPLDADGKDSEGNAQNGDWRMTCEIEFDPDEYGFIAFCYRITKRAHISPNNIYIRDDQHSGEFEGTTGMWTANGLSATGEWRVRVLEIKKSFPAANGTVKSLRIPIASRVNEEFDIKYVAAFKTKEDAADFDIDEYHTYLLSQTTEAPDDTEAPDTEKTADSAGESASAHETAKPDEDKGCGSVLSGSAAVLAVISIAAATLRKRED